MTTTFKKIGVSVAAASAATLAWVSVAGAQAATGLTGASAALTSVAGQIGATGQRDLPTLVGGIINVILGILGIVFVVLIVWAGFMYMLAGGDQEKVKKATAIIRNALIGLVITVAAYAIANYVVSALTAATTG